MIFSLLMLIVDVLKKKTLQFVVIVVVLFVIDPCSLVSIVLARQVVFRV